MEINCLKKLNIHLQEKCTVQNIAITHHTNINSKLDLFPDKLHPNGCNLSGNNKAFWKVTLEGLLTIVSFDVFHKVMTLLLKIAIYR